MWFARENLLQDSGKSMTHCDDFDRLILIAFKDGFLWDNSE